MKILFNYLIFPGFLFSACVGLMSGWLDRKVTARIQYRVGPPWHQNFTDLIKLCFKETIVPQGTAKWTFLFSPFLGLFSLMLVTVILGQTFILPDKSFIGDLIVLVYLLTIPALSLIMGAFSSRNPLASVGASREMKLILSYELPFILAVIVLIIKSGGALRLNEIIASQVHNSYFFSASGAIAFFVTLFCFQAKLGFAPFEISEAEQEIMGGVLIEYSGFPLAIYKLNKALLVYSLPLVLIIFFFGKDLSFLFIALKFIMIQVLFILIKNTNPRLRIDQAMRFFWGPVTLLSIVAIVLAILGY